MASDPAITGVPPVQEGSAAEIALVKRLNKAFTRVQVARRTYKLPVSVSRNAPGNADDVAEKALLREIDAGLARLESGITAERAAMDALLDRLNNRAA